ncbi:MAG: alpha/beta fold hydrolase [Gemmatimonadaceae bacterium]|nr:alpha/beta fold hydrolase [Gemmatimonadaceae bacterium]
MQRVIRRIGALVGALAVAIMVFVVAASLDLGVLPLAVMALAAFLVSGYALLRFSLRFDTSPAVQGDRRVPVWRWLVGGAAAYAMAAQLLVGTAPSHDVVAPTPTPDTKFWTLGNGSRIAYEVAPATGASRHAPIVVLHDGPGMPVLPFLHALGKRPLDFVRDDGYDVYYYDQLGAGLSGRIDLTAAPPYTVARHVADLEEIRRTLNVPKMVLFGTGWGATLAVDYLAEHAEHVEKLILESPVAVWAPAWPDQISPTARAKMTDVQASALAALQRPPLRLVLGRMMADFSPRAAHTFIADWEGDQWWTKTTEESIRLGQPNYTCHTDPGQGIPVPSGLGFFANSYTLADAVRRPDIRPTLAKIPTSALILRGTCDYTDWRVSTEYLRLLSGAHYVAIPAAGHFIWLEQESMFAEVVRAYLRGEALPLEAYDPAHRMPLPR